MEFIEKPMGNSCLIIEELALLGKLEHFHISNFSIRCEIPNDNKYREIS